MFDSYSKKNLGKFLTSKINFSFLKDILFNSEFKVSRKEYLQNQKATNCLIIMGDKRARICIFMDNFICLLPISETHDFADIAANFQ